MMRNISIVLLVFCSIPLSAFAQLWPHIKTFGYDYGYPKTIENLQFIATHHDMVIGAGEWQDNRISEFQYDTMKAVNPDVIIVPYTVIQAFTFEAMETFFNQWASNNGYTVEDLYIHYYNDQIVKMRTAGIKTSGTGAPSDRICDSNGNLLPTGQQGIYYISLGYGGGSANNLKEARTYQYWNAGFEARFNHLSAAWQGAYKSYTLDVITVNANKNKYCDGIYLDTYTGIVDLDGYLPNMHQLREIRNSGYSSDDMAARKWYASTVAAVIGNTEQFLKTKTGKSKIYMIANGGDLGYAHGSYKFALDDQLAPAKLNVGAIEFLTAPSKTVPWTVDSYVKDHFLSYDNATWTDQVDTSWYNFGKTTPPLGGKQFMIGSLYLFYHPETFFGLHYGTPGSYGPGLYPNIGEKKGGTYEESHWDPMMEYDIGIPVVHEEKDIWGATNTNRMYVVEHFPTPGYPIAARYVLARDFSKAKVLVRFEKSDNNIPYDPNYNQIGSDPRAYGLGGNYRRLLADGSLGPVVSSVTLGLAEGAIMIRESSQFSILIKTMKTI